MIYLPQLFAHAFAKFSKRVGIKNEHGQATAEYGVVILVAVALGLAVLMLFTGGTFNALLSGIVQKVLSLAIDKIHF